MLKRREDVREIYKCGKCLESVSDLLGWHQVKHLKMIYKEYMLSPTAGQHTQITNDLLNIAKEMVRKRGRRFSDLRFAKRTLTGYAFFEEPRGRSAKCRGVENLHLAL